MSVGSGDLDTFQSENADTSPPAAPVKAQITPPPGKIIPPLPKIDSPPANLDPQQESIPPEWDVIAPRRALTADTVPSIMRARQESAGGAGGARRVGLLALTLLLVAAIGWLAYLYQRIVPYGRDTTAGIAVSEPQTPNEQNRHSPVETPLSSGTNTTAAPREAPRVADTAAAPQPSSQGAASTPLPGSRPAAPSPIATGSASPESANSVGTAGSVLSVAGSWTLATLLEPDSNASSSSVQLGYQLQLQQTGDRVTGAGRAVREDGAGVNGRAETPISVAGTIQGNRLTLAFTERGDSGPARGKFVLLLEDDRAIMRGRFSSTAAPSSGTVEARRVR